MGQNYSSLYDNTPKPEDFRPFSDPKKNNKFLVKILIIVTIIVVMLAVILGLVFGLNNKQLTFVERKEPELLTPTLPTNETNLSKEITLYSQPVSGTDYYQFNPYILNRFHFNEFQFDNFNLFVLNKNIETVGFEGDTTIFEFTTEVQEINLKLDLTFKISEINQKHLITHNAKNNLFISLGDSSLLTVTNEGVTQGGTLTPTYPNDKLSFSKDIEIVSKEIGNTGRYEYQIPNFDNEYFISWKSNNFDIHYQNIYEDYPTHLNNFDNPGILTLNLNLTFHWTELRVKTDHEHNYLIELGQSSSLTSTFVNINPKI